MAPPSKPAPAIGQNGEYLNSFFCTFESSLIANVPFFPILYISLINHFIEFIASMHQNTTMAPSKDWFGSGNWSMVSF